MERLKDVEEKEGDFAEDKGSCDSVRRTFNKAILESFVINKDFVKMSR